MVDPDNHLAGAQPEWLGWPAEFAQHYRRAGYWQGLTFGDLLACWAKSFGEETALVDGDRRWSYRDLDSVADRIRNSLYRAGLRAGDRLIVQSPNRAEFVLLWFGMLRLGIVPVHAMPAHRRSEIGHLLTMSGAAGYLIPDRYARFDYRTLAAELREEIPTLRTVFVLGDPGDTRGFVSVAELMSAEAPQPETTEPRPDELAILLLSGGTTGVPKLIPRTHNDYAYNARAAAEVCGLDRHSVYLAVLPIAFNFTMSCPGVLGTLGAGGRVVIAPDPSPRTAFDLIAAERVSITAINPPLVPHWLDEFDKRGGDLSSLDILQVGSARLTDDLARAIKPVLGCSLQQVFGMAEGLLCLTRLDDTDDIVCTTQGRPISDADETRVVDEGDRVVPLGEVGELCVRGPYTLRSYYRAAETNDTAFTSDGYYRTGDQVRALPSGHLVVVGRTKDQINRGGEKIDATEVESHLLAHPEILEAALVAEPDAALGERSLAVLRCAGDPLTAAEIARFLRARGLAAYKRPDRVVVVDNLPLTAVGKIDKKVLASRHSVTST